MKKLVLLLAVAFSVSMFSCGKGDANTAVDSDSIKAAAEKVEAAPEAPAADTVAAPAADTTATVAE